MARLPDTPEALKAALGYEHNFVEVESVDAGRIELSFDLSPERWPWLALPPTHPVLIEKVQYFAAVTASWVSDSMQPGTRSALTRITWDCSPGAGAYPRRAVSKPWQGERSMGYELRVYDAEDRELYVIRGEGSSFEDRDFEAWREKTRREARAAAKPLEIDPGPDGMNYLGPVREVEGQLVAAACVPSGRAFQPGHPFHTGTGDHVNAAHLFDCALQMAGRATGRAPAALDCRGGEARFQRFIELDVPLEVRLLGRETLAEGGAALEIGFSQGGRDNASVLLRLADAS